MKTFSAFCLAFSVLIVDTGCGSSDAPPKRVTGSGSSLAARDAGPIILSGDDAPAEVKRGGPITPPGGTITQIAPATGGGLYVNGGTSAALAGAVTVGLRRDCSALQVPQWSGTAWTCGSGFPTDTIEGTLTSPDLVAATGAHTVGNYAGSTASACSSGTAATDAALSAAGALSLRCNQFVNGTGTSGDLLVWVGAGGATNYAGTSCASDKATTSISAAGAATCAYFVDAASSPVAVLNNTVSLNFSTGLTTSGGNLIVDETREQRRVTGTCTTPNAIDTVNADGTVTCSTGVLNTTNVSGTTNDLAIFTATNTVGNYAGASSCSAGSFFTGLSAIGASTCTATGLNGLTTNRVVKAASGTTIGNSDISDDGITIDFTAGAAKATTKVASGNTAISGTLVTTNEVTMSESAADGNGILTVQNLNTAQTGSLGVGITAKDAATYNTTGGVALDVALSVSNTSSRSSGSNALTNEGIFIGVSGAQTNYALYVDTGDVVLNATSGVTTIDGMTALNGATTAANTLTANGTTGANSFTANFTQTAQTSSLEAVNVTNTGTFNTTSAGLSSYAIKASDTSTRSSGSNTLTNYGIYATASGAQTNYSGYFDSGLFQVNGAASFASTGAFTSTLTADSGLRVFDVAGTGLTSSTNTVSLNINGGTTQTCAANTAVTALTGAGITTCTTFINGSGTVVGTVENLALFTATNTIGNAPVTYDTNLLVIATSAEFEPLRITTNSAATLTKNYNATIAFGATTGLASDVTSVLADSGTLGAVTLDATAVDRNSYALYGSSTATRSAGANNVINHGVFGAASGGQTNYSGYFDTGLFQVNGASTISNKLTVSGASAADTLTVNFTQTAQTAAHSAIAASDTGSFNTTSGALSDYAINASNTATRSSGSNALTNYGVYTTASGGQTNYALYADSGDVKLNATSGVTTVVGAASFTSSTATSFTTGASGINGYGSTHLEWADEWLMAVSGSITGNTAIGSAYNFTCSGTGCSIADTAGVTQRPGIVDLGTGTTTTGWSAITGSPNAVNFGDGNFQFEWVGGFPTLANSTDIYVGLIGFFDTTSSINQVDGCFFAYDGRNQLAGGPNSGVANQMECWCSSNSTRTAYLLNGSGNSDESFAKGIVNVGALSYPNTNVLHLLIKVTSTTRAEFYTVSGTTQTKVCDINTNMPSGSARLTGAGFQIAKTAGTTARTMDTDFTKLAIDLTSLRSP